MSAVSRHVERRISLTIRYRCVDHRQTAHHIQRVALSGRQVERSVAMTIARVYQRSVSLGEIVNDCLDDSDIAGKNSNMQSCLTASDKQSEITSKR